MCHIYSFIKCFHSIIHQQYVSMSKYIGHMFFMLYYLKAFNKLFWKQHRLKHHLNTCIQVVNHFKHNMAIDSNVKLSLDSTSLVC